MKCFERVIKDFIISKLPPSFDLFQFAYRPNRSTEDAISSALHVSLEQLEKRNTHVRMLFLDFSSAFYTIIPQRLVHKLAPLDFRTPLCNQLLDFLTNRTQSVRVGSNIFNVISLSTGSPQDCVLSSLLFTLMPHDCRPKFSTNHILKYADDREEVRHLEDWCEVNNLFLNISKTKEIIVDFRRSRPSHTPLLINNTAVEVVENIKFLGVHITDNLSWSLHITSQARKAQQRLRFLCRLREPPSPLPSSPLSTEGPLRAC
ncbi:uncharacterized protein LOC115403198 [Salarias fasciatus]|uniref:uncharacterized protein LOC115403198 n=1 Tax=Salarias fasciatus TaxID=181472 RepID=UPI00117671DF|nr:uncharacterized protein LOC115403198 [Salarias fasciatus]